jgi:hypothetical protein
MFISNKEKSDINESISCNRSQIENVVKHIAKLQVDMGNSEIPNLAGIRMSNEQLQKMYFGAKNEMKKMQQQLTMLREINDLIIERVTSLEVLVKRSRITIPKEKVQEMKDAGTWQDPEKRDSLLATFIKEKRKAEEQKEKQRQYKREYYLKKKAEKAAQQALL